jgi:hypothetical protein
MAVKQMYTMPLAGTDKSLRYGYGSNIDVSFVRFSAVSPLV